MKYNIEGRSFYAQYLKPRRSVYVFHYQDHLQCLSESIVAGLLPAHCHHWRFDNRTVLCNPKSCQKRGRKPDKTFFHSFKENFRQGTIIWLILLTVGIVLGVDGYIFYHMRFENAFWTVATAVFLIAAAAYAIILMYIFPLLARFDNTIRTMFKNAIMLGMRFLLCTVVMAVIYFAMVFVIINIFTPMIIFGEGLCALLCSYLLSNILLLCQEKQEETTQTSESANTKETTEIIESAKIKEHEIL